MRLWAGPGLSLRAGLPRRSRLDQDPRPQRPRGPGGWVLVSTHRVQETKPGYWCRVPSKWIVGHDPKPQSAMLVLFPP